MKILDAIEYQNKTRQILSEGYQDLTESQKIYLNRWEKELWPLLEEYNRLAEATLTTDQIQDIFKGAEQQSIAGGQNKTMLGKVGGAVGAAAKLPVDIAKAVDKKINELGRMAQNAGPVKNMDAKFEELKKKIGDKDSKIVAGVKRVSDWAKDNPGKASLAVGILTTVAAFAGGPAGGAAAGLIFRASKDLLQGEKLSTAVGKAAKTAAYGALAGMAFRALSDNVIDNVMNTKEAEWVAMEKSYMDANLADAKAEVASKFGLDNVDTALDGAARYQLTGNYNAFYYDYDVIIPADKRATFDALKAAMDNTESFSDAQIKATMKFHDFMGQLVKDPESQKLMEVLEAIKNIPQGELTSAQTNALLDASDNLDKLYDALDDIGPAGSAALQGAAAMVDEKSKEAIKAKPVPKKVMKQLELEFEKETGKNEDIDYRDAVQHLFEQYMIERDEDPRQGELKLDNPNSLGAKVKRGLGKAVGAVGKGAGKAVGAVGKGAKAVGGTVKSVGKELGNKVTAKKLNKAWEKAGKPTDAGSIYNILSSQGLDDGTIKSIGKEQEVNIVSTKPSAKDQPSADTGAQQASAQPKGSAGTASSASATPAKTEGPSLANRMAGEKKAGHTWKGGQWVNDETGKIGSTEKLGNPLVAKLAQEIKASGESGIEQIKQILSGPMEKPKPVAAKPKQKSKAKPTPKVQQKAQKVASKKVFKKVQPTIHSKSKSPTA